MLRLRLSLMFARSESVCTGSPGSTPGDECGAAAGGARYDYLRAGEHISSRPPVAMQLAYATAAAHVLSTGLKLEDVGPSAPLLPGLIPLRISTSSSRKGTLRALSGIWPD